MACRGVPGASFFGVFFIIFFKADFDVPGTLFGSILEAKMVRKLCFGIIFGRLTFNAFFKSILEGFKS